MTDFPLEGVRVLELAPGYAAAFAGRMLAGYGADVVCAGEPHDLSPDELTWLMPGVRRVNARAFDDLHPLALAADIVLIDSPGWSDVPFGDEVRATLEGRSDVIVVSVTPFGQTGRSAGWAATNLTAFAMGGIVSLTGHPSREPLVTGGSQAYALGGLNAFSAALAAYYGRLVHGEGDWIEFGQMGAYSNTMRTSFNGFFAEEFVYVRDAAFLPTADMLPKAAPRTKAA